jgi:glycosyltransferase involved in cell wall biosynthesis
MACGKAVIAANASSLPEVIGHPEALFAARDDVAMRDKMTQVLEDVTLRQRLEQHGLEQAQKFSWQKGAAQAWQALEKLHAEHKAMKPTRPRRGQRPKLAFVSPLPDARSGIADYAAELLPELARHYDITAIIAQKEPVTDPWILANVPIRDVAWFEQHAARFDRLLYQFGNSPYHSPMFDLLQKYPGVIVLHDYFLSGVICHRDGIGETSGEFPRQLQHGHGFPALQWRHAHPNDWAEDGAISRYSCNLTVLQNALNVIVHSQHTKRLAEVDYGVDAVREWFVIPDFCHTLSELDRYTRAEAGGSSGNAQAHACKQIRPRTCADAYAEAIEATYQKAESGGFGALRRIAAHEPGLFGSDVPGLARAYADNFPPTPRMPQLLLDISELVQRDAKTGIQRVTRALLSEIVQNPPSGWQIEAVYATTDQPGYRYARKFLSRVLEIPDDWANDEPVQVWPGDLFFGMDFQREVIAAQIPLLRDWRNRGVPCYFVVHDLLPVTMPEVFPEGSRDGHQAWLSAITQLDGALCVSRHVADELYDWLQHFGAERRRPYTIGWFHHGSDLESSAPTRGMPQDASTVLSLLQARPTFLMVGTIEPRKGYLQTLQAFDLLWADGVDVNLVIVGKEGWTPLPDSARRDIPETVRYLRAHPELGKRLHLLAGISDEYLEAVYATSNCLIAASYDEGFGLPIIEAAHHGLPLLVRDIPVFHEVTADQAFFFADSRQPEVIATAVKEWLNLYQQNAHPRSDALPHQNWSDSARQVLDALLGIKAPYRTWLPDGVIRYWGNDPRLHSRVGERGYGRETRTTGKAGHLIYGPYRHLEAGSYRLIISGYAEYWTGSESIAVCYNRGERQISYNKADCKKIGLWQEVIDFDIQDQLEDYEIQFYVDQSSKLSIDSIIICKKVVPNNSEEDLMAYINSRLDLVQYVEDFRSTKNSTIMLQTSDPYRYKRLLCTSQEINQKYCNKYGIQYKKFIGIRYGIYPHHAMFNRIYEIKRLVDDGYAGWVFYLDADSILYREDFDLQKKLSDLKKDGKFAWLHNVYLKDDPLYAFERINDGAFALNLESGYVRLLVDIWDKIYSDYYSYEIFSSAIKWEDIFNDNGSFNIILLSLANRFGDDFKNGIMFEQFQDCWNSDTYHEGVVFQALRFRHDGISPDDELELRRDALIKKMGSSSNHVEL